MTAYEWIVETVDEHEPGYGAATSKAEVWKIASTLTSKTANCLSISNTRAAARAPKSPSGSSRRSEGSSDRHQAKLDRPHDR